MQKNYHESRITHSRKECSFFFELGQLSLLLAYKSEMKLLGKKNLIKIKNSAVKYG